MANKKAPRNTQVAKLKEIAFQHIMERAMEDKDTREEIRRLAGLGDGQPAHDLVNDVLASLSTEVFLKLFNRKAGK